MKKNHLPVNHLVDDDAFFFITWTQKYHLQYILALKSIPSAFQSMPIYFKMIIVRIPSYLILVYVLLKWKQFMVNKADGMYEKLIQKKANKKSATVLDKIKN